MATATKRPSTSADEKKPSLASATALNYRLRCWSSRPKISTRAPASAKAIDVGPPPGVEPHSPMCYAAQGETAPLSGVRVVAESNANLHGSAPDKSGMALLLIDVINDFDFPEAEQLLQFARPMAARVAELAVRARAIRVPVVYVNDELSSKLKSDHFTIKNLPARLARLKKDPWAEIDSSKQSIKASMLRKLKTR
jgi:hypothetical protein